MTSQESQLFFQRKNKNKDFTLIARDCVGGALYHQLGLRFLSPTINLFFIPEDFNQFCLHLRDYIDGQLIEFKDKNTDYPVGLLYPTSGIKPVRIDFMHYDSFEEAFHKWNERKERINWENIFVLSTMCYPKETAVITPQLIEEWNKIPYKKVMLVDKEYGFDDEYVIEKPSRCHEYAWLLFTPGWKHKWKKTFNKFNFIKFFNR